MSTEARRKIAQAADDLLREGIRPTQQLIRERIGTGSITTINRGLNEWWQALSERFNENGSGGTIPEPVIRLSSRLWSESMAYAREEHSKLRSEQEEVINKLNNQLLRERSDYSGKLHTLSKTLSDQQERIAELEQQRQTLQKTLHQAEEECYRLSKIENSRKNSRIPEGQDDLHDQLLEERVKVRMKQESIDELLYKNQKLIEENAELKLKLKQALS